MTPHARSTAATVEHSAGRCPGADLPPPGWRGRSARRMSLSPPRFRRGHDPSLLHRQPGLRPAQRGRSAGVRRDAGPVHRPVVRLAGAPAGPGSRALQATAAVGGATAVASLAASGFLTAASPRPTGRRTTTSPWRSTGVPSWPAGSRTPSGTACSSAPSAWPGNGRGAAARPGPHALASAAAGLLAPLYLVAEPAAWFIPAGGSPDLWCRAWPGSGWSRSALSPGELVTAHSLGPRLWAAHRRDRWKMVLRSRSRPRADHRRPVVRRVVAPIGRTAQQVQNERGDQGGQWQCHERPHGAAEGAAGRCPRRPPR